MAETYPIGPLVARAWMGEQGMRTDHMERFECEEGTADLVTQDGEGATVLVSVEAHRQRKGEQKPSMSPTRARRVSMAYLVRHPEVSELEFDAMVVTIGNGNTATVSVKRVYEFVR